MKVIIYDGECSICTLWTKYIIKKDIRENLYFANAQSTYAKNNLGKILDNSNSTILFWDDEKIYQRSNAILKILSYIPHHNMIVTLGYYIPEKIRDSLYNMFAKYRYKIIGKKQYCDTIMIEKLPSNWRKRFLS